MGLDGVEILMAAEEKFGITICDEEAQNIRTVGDMYELVMSKVTLAGDSSCLSQRAFHRLRRNAIACFGVNRRDFKLDTELDGIVPRQDRRKSGCDSRGVLERFSGQAWCGPVQSWRLSPG